jgi:hypothetical protein
MKSGRWGGRSGPEQPDLNARKRAEGLVVIGNSASTISDDMNGLRNFFKPGKPKRTAKEVAEEILKEFE